MIEKNIKKLRKLFEVYDIDGYLISSNDEYLSEYVADYAKRLEFITGFTGSNGMALICKGFAYFFTDGRYIEQSNKELDLKIFEIEDLQNLSKVLTEICSTTDVVDSDEFSGKDKNSMSNMRASNNKGKGKSINYKIGYDARVFSHRFIKSLNLMLHPIDDNLIDIIWKDQPKKPASEVYIYSEKYAGQRYEEKINLCRIQLQKYGAKYLIITKSDSICWILNIRASDVDYCPILLGTLVISEDISYLFTNITRIDQNIKSLRPDIVFYEEEKLISFISSVNEKFLIDENNSNNFVINLIKNPQNITDPTLLMRACKNDTEIQCAINSHIHDAVAIIEFLSYLSELDLRNFTEYDLATMLTTFRKKQPLYIMESFATICGFKENGSIIHYHATPDKAKPIIGSGLLLIDSGAQYLGCTTDITRTISIGKTHDEEKKYYTKVLKGHIALSNIKFLTGTSGANLDILARQYLWEEGENYSHGTGHGVGSFLNVHEGPQSINKRNNVPLECGMILSNEPGYYKTGHYGIRIENLMYVEQSEYKDYLEFQTLSLVPFDKKLIDVNLLTDNDLSYIRKYYDNIDKKVTHLLGIKAQKWLKEALSI